jgi:pimeloyl-ACP methyl ester carboxylesterase
VRFVLVHGAWHGAWCWEELKRELASRGHEVTALDLCAQGDDEMDARDATAEENLRRIDAALEPGSVLVGHSLGGYWVHVAAARAPERVSRLVYLATVVALPGEIWADTIARHPVALAVPAPDAERGVIPVPEDPIDGFYLRCSPEVAKTARARLRPLPTRPLAEMRPPAEVFDGDRISIVCREDHAIPAQVATESAKQAGVSVVSIDGDHSPFYSNVSELARVLEGGSA